MYDTASLVPSLLDDGNRKYVWGAAGLAYAVDGNSNLEVYHQDGLGSVRAVTYANGNITQTYGADEFGVQNPALTQGTSNQPFQFTGEERDKETGFGYLRARMYDPQIGRFIQRDPVTGNKADPQSLNRYDYAVNNPATFTDPSGLCRDPNPYGVGLRYCIGRFIPTATDPLGFFLGDNRGPVANGGTSRVEQYLVLGPSGGLTSWDQPGHTTVLNPLTGEAIGGGQGTDFCSAVKSKALGTSTIAATCDAYNGAFRFGVVPIPLVNYPIKTDIIIQNGQVISAAGTTYPSLEVYQYGGPSGPSLIYSYDAVAAGTNPYTALPEGTFLGPQPLPCNAC